MRSRQHEHKANKMKENNNSGDIHERTQAEAGQTWLSRSLHFPDAASAIQVSVNRMESIVRAVLLDETQINE